MLIQKALLQEEVKCYVVATGITKLIICELLTALTRNQIYLKTFIHLSFYNYQFLYFYYLLLSNLNSKKLFLRRIENEFANLEGSASEGRSGWDVEPAPSEI